MSQERTCHYCGLPKCRCTYRFMRKGLSGIEVYNTSAQTTYAEVKKVVCAYFDNYPPETPVIFKFSLTRIDPKATGKTKRGAIYDSDTAGV